MTTETLSPSAVGQRVGVGGLVLDRAHGVGPGMRFNARHAQRSRSCADTPAAKDMGTCGAVMRICLVYDCLFPHTVGGAERWYRSLAERLAADGHEVTYLTLRQWDRGDDPGVKGVDVRVVGPRMKLYSGPGQRRILPPLVFGVGVLWHLARHGRRYDVVHTCSFPYFSLLAAALVGRSIATAWPPTGLRCGAGATGASTWDRVRLGRRPVVQQPVRAGPAARVLLLRAVRPPAA